MAADRKLKIAFISAHSCPVGMLGTRDTGGMSVYIREVATELGRRGHQVDIFTRIHDPVDKPVYQLGENTRLIHLKTGSLEEIPKLNIYPSIPEFCANLESYRRQHGLEYDLIFSHYWLSGCAGLRLQKMWQVPQVTMFHTLAAVKNSLGGHEPKIRVRNEQKLVDSIQRIITTSVREKKNLVRLYHAAPEMVSVIPCGVNLELFQPVAKKVARDKLGLNGEPIILFAGRIDPLKGLDRLLRVTARLDELEKQKTTSYEKTHLIIIGGDKEKENGLKRLKTMARSLKITDRITFEGLVQQEKLPLYYSAADVFVLPSYYESFGMVALESLACGTPVVAGDVADLHDIIRDGVNGYIVNSGSENEFAEKITNLLDKSQSCTSSTTLRKTALHFNWQATTDKLLMEFYKLLAG